MAKKETNEIVAAETPQAEAKESVYKAAELVKNHRALGSSYAIAKIALQLAGIEEATVTEAKRVIDQFKNKEVK